MTFWFRRFSVLGLLALAALFTNHGFAAQEQPSAEYDYLLLATSKTSTMQNEMQEAAESGYVFVGVMGGDTALGGSEVVVVMERRPGAAAPQFEYRLLATSKTSTMQNELQEAGDAGFSFRGQTVFGSRFGGDEPVVILERSLDMASPELFEYRLLATKKTSTMAKELREAGAVGFRFVGVTVSSTRFGGDEIVAILKRPVVDR